MKKFSVVLCLVLFVLVLSSCDSLFGPSETGWARINGYDRYGYMFHGSFVDVDCPIGAQGPAGGVIFYDVDADNNMFLNDGLVSSEIGYRYLEAAPGYLKGTGDNLTLSVYSSASNYIMGYFRTSDNGINLRPNGTTSYAMFDGSCTVDDIGSGRHNTDLLVSSMGESAYAKASGSEKVSDYAAMAVKRLSVEFDGRTYSDWFIPSAEEFQAVYENTLVFLASITDVNKNAVLHTSSEKSESSLVISGTTYPGPELMHDYAINVTDGTHKTASKPRNTGLKLLPVRQVAVAKSSPVTPVPYVPHYCTTPHKLVQNASWVRIGDKDFYGRKCSLCDYVEEVPRSVGDEGPTGGKIFYVASASEQEKFGWKYLEAAPGVILQNRETGQISLVESEIGDGVSAIDDSFMYFGFHRLEGYGFDGYSNLYVNGTATWNASDCTGYQIGDGARNTRLLVQAMGDVSSHTRAYQKNRDELSTRSYGANLCDKLVYMHNGIVFDDWFLPSLVELQTVFNNNCQPEGCMGGRYYMSSSEDHASTETQRNAVVSSSLTGGATADRTLFYYGIFWNGETASKKYILRGRLVDSATGSNAIASAPSAFVIPVREI